jgi:hypothetical protein
MKHEVQLANAKPDVISPADLLTPQELADRLKVRLSWIYERTRSGGDYGNPLPVLPCGRYLRFDWQEVCAWLRSNPKLVRERNPAKKKRNKKPAGERSDASTA